MAQGIEWGSVNQKVAGSIPSQGTCLGCGPGPHLGCARSSQSVSLLHIYFLSLSPSYPPLYLKINKIFKKEKEAALNKIKWNILKINTTTINRKCRVSRFSVPFALDAAPSHALGPHCLPQLVVMLSPFYRWDNRLWTILAAGHLDAHLYTFYL